MKQISYIIAFLFIWAQSAQSQSFCSQSKGVYGINVSQSYASFEDGLRYNITSNIESEKKVFEIGLILQNSKSIIGGAEFSYKHFILPKIRTRNKRNFRPYIHYNFIYNRMTPFKKIGLRKKSSDFNTILNNGGSVSLEHLAGIGIQIKILKTLFLDTSVGYGAYLGGIDNPELAQSDVKSIGKTLNLKIGFNYFFEKRGYY